MRTFFIFALCFAGATGDSYAQLFKCLSPEGKTSYQAAPCASNDKESSFDLRIHGPTTAKQNDGTPLTKHVELTDASVVQVGPNKNGFLHFELRPKWTNNNSKPVTIYYKTYFYDHADVELHVDSRFKEMNPSGSSTARQVLATFNAGKHNSFDYTKVRKMEIRYKIKGDETERVLKNLQLNKSS